ncbi:MAG: NAD(P)/FAD-dependent oxidoreductase [Nitrososphaerota archaeon]|nr:NAD(P)/FAD-dependent oxidoreductase [Candidatus Bathyarchaeota archaeon]MDW8048113.1 NAD(P)/FAD-dependent oxidoreductase [Nitrososphaerota archaeon]
MRSESTDILIIGAGPAGLISACEALKIGGAEIIIVEEHEQIGIPCHCAGLLSISGLQRIGLSETGDYIQNSIRGARFFSPSGLSFQIERDEPIAYVIERSMFDEYLATKARNSGAHIYLGVKVNSIQREGGESLAYYDEGFIRAKVVIDAGGTSSLMLRLSGLETLNIDDLIPGIQMDLGGIDVEPEYVEIHVSKKIAPSFFAWVIPLTRKVARVGLACKGGNPKLYLERFVEKRFGDLRNLEVIKTRSGRVVTCGPIKKTYDDGLLIVGDAAGQVKPTTGGGVILGGICARIAGRVAVEAVNRGDFSGEYLRVYEELWRREVGKELSIGYAARRVLNHLSDEVIDKIFKIIAEDETLQELISAEGDMDFQSKILWKIAARREILSILSSAIRSIIHF